jgi:hypothetical protein
VGKFHDPNPAAYADRYTFTMTCLSEIEKWSEGDEPDQGGH